jgi:hypothetical protein
MHEQMSKALLAYQSGNLELALELFNRLAPSEIDDDELIYYRGCISRRLEPRVTAPATLVWQSWTRGMWEGDWLKEILEGSYESEAEDNAHAVVEKRMIVVDNRISKVKVDYYRRAYEAGSRIVLIHLSDEDYSDCHEAYRWCHAVFRTSYSPILAELPRVDTIALGYKTGFRTKKEATPLSERPYIWSFAGDPAKSSRAEMLEAFRQLTGGREHLTSGFNKPDALPVREYREIMDGSVFIPCPAGYVNLDSFRVYEALEAGCIPIVERRHGFDYFAEMYGQYPFPSVANWPEAISLIHHLQEYGGVQPLMERCQQWWAWYKHSLIAKIRGAVVKTQG